jgi:hypothetical protein
MQIMNVGRFVVIGYGFFMGVLAIVLFEIGLSLGWVYLFMGVVIGSAVFPIYACLTWNKTSATAAIAGAAIGMIGAVVAWLVQCQVEFGEINIDNLGAARALLPGLDCQAAAAGFHNAVLRLTAPHTVRLMTSALAAGADYPMLAGNVAALGISLIVTIVASYVWPQNFDWEIMKNEIKARRPDLMNSLSLPGSHAVNTWTLCSYMELACHQQSFRSLAMINWFEHSDQLTRSRGQETLQITPKQCS